MGNFLTTLGTVSFSRRNLLHGVSGWPHCEQPRWHSSLFEWDLPAVFDQYWYFFYFRIFRLGFKVCLCPAGALHYMLHYEYCMFPTPFRDQLTWIYYPLSSAQRVSDSKICGAITSSPTLKVSWMYLCIEVMADGFKKPLTEGWQSFYWINECTENVRLQHIPTFRNNELFTCNGDSDTSFRQICTVPYNRRLGR